MKKNNLIILFALTATFVNGQIIPLLNNSQPYASIEGAYYKDVNNDMNKFEGEWLWQNGNSSLLLKLEKVEAYSRHNSFKDVNFTVDILVGEYKYIENGTELINTLPLFNTLEGAYHNIYGILLLRKYNRPKCNECGQDEIRIMLRLTDPNRPYIRTTLLLRHQLNPFTQQESITARIYTSYTPPNSQYIEATVPSDTYILFKQ